MQQKDKNNFEHSDKVEVISNEREVYSFSVNTQNPSTIKITAVIASIANKIGVPPTDIIKEAQEKAKAYPFKTSKVYAKVIPLGPKKFELSLYTTKAMRIKEIVNSSEDHSKLLYEYAQELADQELANQKTEDLDLKKQTCFRIYNQLKGQYNSHTSRIPKKL